MSFKDKVVLVTGASSGIGAATAIAFVSAGAKVTIVGRNQQKLKIVAETCERTGSKPLVVLADVTNNDDVKRILEDTLKHYGKLDILVNNAGVEGFASILAPNAMEVYNKVMATNLDPVVYLTQLAAPHLIKTKGNIINVSSVGSLAVLVDNCFAYLTSKAAMDHFTRSIAFELAPKGVRANTVNPGPVKTDTMEALPEEQRNAMLEAMKKVPLGRFGEPEEIADLIMFLASDEARSITGSTFVSDNGAKIIGPVEIQPKATRYSLSNYLCASFCCLKF